MYANGLHAEFEGLNIKIMENTKRASSDPSDPKKKQVRAHAVQARFAQGGNTLNNVRTDCKLNSC